MYINNEDREAKIGRVKVETVTNSVGNQKIRLRWTINKRTRALSIGEYNKFNWKAALAKAQEIDADITFDRYDDTLAKYSPKYAQELELLETKKQPNLWELWERYKEANQDNVSHSTISKDWTRVETILKLAKNQNLKATDSDIRSCFINALDIYAKGTIKNPLMSLSGCLTWSRKQGYEVDNPCTDIKQEIEKGEIKKPIECFEDIEIKAILKAFYEDIYLKPKSRSKPSYYAHYVHFLALTGCRPEEAIALTWDDIKESGEKKWILINKRFTHGKLTKGTKNKTIRPFPVNDQLQGLIQSIPKRHETLVFPSNTMKYLRQDHFLNKYWSPIVHSLLEDGLVSKYLPTKNLRQSFITRMIRQGYDVATIARLVGNTPQTIHANYLAAKDDLIPPSFDF